MCKRQIKTRGRSSAASDEYKIQERKLINIPMRIKPPNIPKIEDKNAVAKVAIRINNKIKSISIYNLLWQEICNSSSFNFKK